MAGSVDPLASAKQTEDSIDASTVKANQARAKGAKLSAAKTAQTEAAKGL